jgi:ABC-type enterobactin transport system permease subunit
MMKGGWWEAGLAVSLLFSVLMGSLLLIPTEIMPEKIRLAHLIEVSLSNFLFGWVVVWLFHRRHTRGVDNPLKPALKT